MSNIDAFEQAQAGIRALDLQGETICSKTMFLQYQRRNTFGLDLDSKIHRIFQKDFLDEDISGGCLTFPKASSLMWNDPLENPLADVQATDPVTHLNIDLGALVRSFYALCWTDRSEPQPSDWSCFSHGKRSVRITTTVRKLMDRLMCSADPNYMHRVWLVKVDYKDPALIKEMQRPSEVLRRMDFQGALLAISTAVVRSRFTCEDEVRLLFDASIQPTLSGSTFSKNPCLARIPFNWEGFIDSHVCGP